MLLLFHSIKKSVRSTSQSFSKALNDKIELRNSVTGYLTFHVISSNCEKHIRKFRVMFIFVYRIQRDYLEIICIKDDL